MEYRAQFALLIGFAMFGLVTFALGWMVNKYNDDIDEKNHMIAEMKSEIKDLKDELNRQKFRNNRF